MATIEILGKIILIPFFITYIVSLSKLRYSKRATVIIASTFIMLYFIMTFLIIKFFNYLIYEYPILDLLYRILNLIIMTAFSLFLTKQRIVQSIFIIASVFVSISLVGVLAMAVLQVTGLPELPVRIVLHLILGGLLFWSRNSFVIVLDNIKKGWWLLCTVPVFLIANFLFITSIPVSLERNPGNIPAALMLCGMTLIIYTAFVYIIKITYNENHLEQNVTAMKLFISSLEHQNNIAGYNEKKAALFRHDIRHIVQMAVACLDNDDTGEAKKLLCGIDRNINAAESLAAVRRFTGYKLIDTALSYYADYANGSGIDIRIKIEKMVNVAADKTELAVALANALENAASACGQLPENKRCIRISGRNCGNQYFFEIMNTYAGEIRFDPDTRIPVSNKDGHGFGSQSISYFAEKNNAILQYHIKDDWFCLRLLIS